MKLFDRTALERAGVVPGRADAIRRDDATAQEKHRTQHPGRGREASQIHGALHSQRDHTPMGPGLFRGMTRGFPLWGPGLQSAITTLMGNTFTRREALLGVTASAGALVAAAAQAAIETHIHLF